MRNNTTGGRSVARGNGRREQDRPARKSRYSAGEGSVRNSAGEGSAKRPFRKSNGFETPAKGRYSEGRGSAEGRSTGASRSTGKSFERSTGFAGRSFEKGTGSSRGFNSERGTSTGRSFSTGRGAAAGRKPYGENNFKSQDWKKKTTKAAAAPKTAEDGVRLNKFISNSGICSRREADSYITAGVVSINDVVVTELGTKVFPNDVVKFNGERIKGEEKVYIVMNKPKDFVTTVSDPYAEKTILSLVQGKCKARVYPVGRLDKATTGVLLLTNDGELADKLAHPSFEKKKIYHVFLDRNVKGTDMSELVKGITLEDGPISVDEISYIDEDKSQVGVEIHSGRNRIVRRMFEHFGYKVKKLDRVYFAGLTKKNLRRGQWRFLTEQEIAMLKIGSFE